MYDRTHRCNPSIVRSAALRRSLGMEHQLDGVKVGRILRQVAQASANSPDRRLDTSNLEELSHDERP